MKKVYSVLPLLLIFFIQTLQAQFSFTNRNDLLTNSDFHSGVAIAVTDMNDDGLDDIIRMDQGNDLTIEYQVPGGMFSTFNIGTLGNESHWAMCIADVDNNGFNEVLAGGSYNNVHLAMSNGDGTSYTTEYLPGPGLFVQGTNFADINNDGFIDVFSCHDDAESRIWGNDGNGNLLQQDAWIDMSVNGSSGQPASGNYGSVWTDFDNDGDLDLYIAKCRQGVDDTLDQRRINVLYVNDGNNNYTEMGEEYGLRIHWQSWTADFQDANNDGHLDVLLINHDHQAQLMINDGTGHYTEAMNTGIDVSSTQIQGIMRDLDNDGWVDVLIAGNKQQVFRNNGDLTFTEVFGLFDSNDMESFAVGDLNNDGFLDIYGGYANIYTNPSNIDDVLWMNDATSGNNYLTVDLQGVISNRNAIGARIEIYGDWGIQIREVRSGESYGIMNSMIQYFGLGTATEVDSVVVKWPSGLTQSETDVDVNTNLELIEGGCIAAVPVLDVLGSTTFCTGENITISAPSGYATYEWSTGEMSESIVVNSQGIFKVTVTDDNGCIGFSTTISTTVDPILTPEIVAEGPTTFCEGDMVLLTEIGAPNATNYTWSNNDTGNSIAITESGMYSVLAEGLCDDYTSNSIMVEVIDTPDAPPAVGDTVALNEQAMVTAVGSSLTWYDVPSGGTPIGFGADFTTPAITASTIFYVEDGNVLEEGFIESAGMVDHSGTNYSGSNNSNNRLIFTAMTSFTLDSAKVYTDTPGTRKVFLFDDNDEKLDSVIIDVPDGESMHYFGLDVPVGENMYLTTDQMTNFANFNYGGPRLQRSNSNVMYPYDIEDVVSITNSNFGGTWYYYFFDWKISKEEVVCPGDRTPVEVWLDTDIVATIDFGKTNDVRVYPNPSDGNIGLELNFDISEKVQLRVMDLTGKLVLENQLTDKTTQLNLTDLPKGVYVVQISHDGNIYNGKIIIQ